MQDTFDFLVMLFILGGVVYGIATLGFWFAFAVAIVYFWLRLGSI